MPKPTKIEREILEEIDPKNKENLSSVHQRFWVGTSTLDKQGPNEWRCEFKVKVYDIGNRQYETTHHKCGTFGEMIRVAIEEDLKFRIQSL